MTIEVLLSVTARCKRISWINCSRWVWNFFSWKTTQCRVFVSQRKAQFWKKNAKNPLWKFFFTISGSCWNDLWSNPILLGTRLFSFRYPFHLLNPLAHGAKKCHFVLFAWWNVFCTSSQPPHPGTPGASNRAKIKQGVLRYGMVFLSGRCCRILFLLLL